MERLQALKTIELLKSHLNSAEHEFYEVNEKNETLSFENERLKNELFKQEQILKQQQKHTDLGDTLLKTDFSKKFKGSNVPKQAKSVHMEEKSKSVIPKTGYKNKKLYDDIEKLDFDGLRSLGDKLSRII